MRYKSLDEIKSPVVRERARRELEGLIDRFPPAARTFAESISEVVVTIPIRPVPKGRPRIGRGGHAFTPQKTRDYEAAVSKIMRQAMTGRAQIQGPVRVSIQINPSGVVAVFSPIHGHTGSKLRGDVDNYAKAIMDAANGIIFADDKQVMRIEAEKS